ncbi:MAG TPA: zf-HC2 domain-containing protein [Ktedonobacteraceae bacterium]|nr:zf-HC2 domain-containing protein [Ktedonobacteraceae bacterium]
MAQDDRHLTTEQLSALLDKQLSSQEQAEFNAHLQVCQQCQKALADLRQTVTLLHALPQPVLPRSFVLPATQATPSMAANIQDEQRHHGHPVHLTSITRRRRTYHVGAITRQSVRVLSTIAAIIGIVFILSSFLVSNQHGITTASTTSSSGTVHSPATSEPRINGHSTPGQGVQGTTCNQSSPGTLPCDAHTPSTTSPLQKPTAIGSGNGTPQVISRNSQNQTQSPPIDLNSPQVHLGLGAVLLLIGILGVVLTRKRRKQV